MRSTISRQLRLDRPEAITLAEQLVGVWATDAEAMSVLADLVEECVNAELAKPLRAWLGDPALSGGHLFHRRSILNLLAHG